MTTDSDVQLSTSIHCACATQGQQRCAPLPDFQWHYGDSIVGILRSPLTQRWQWFCGNPVSEFLHDAAARLQAPNRRSNVKRFGPDMPSIMDTNGRRRRRYSLGQKGCRQRPVRRTGTVEEHSE
jgi:hypothetical protein